MMPMRWWAWPWPSRCTALAPHVRQGSGVGSGRPVAFPPLDRARGATRPGSTCQSHPYISCTPAPSSPQQTGPPSCAPPRTGPLAFLCAGKLLVAAAQALQVRRSAATAAVALFSATALALTHTFEGAGVAFWAERLLGAGSPWVPTAAALNHFTGVAPHHFGVAVAFRYTLMRYVRWDSSGDGWLLHISSRVPLRPCAEAQLS